MSEASGKETHGEPSGTSASAALRGKLREAASTRIPVSLVLLALAAVSFPTWWPLLRHWGQRKGPGGDPTSRQIHEVVRDVKEELARADSVRIARGERPLFELEYFDLDLKFTLSTSDKTHGQASPAFVVVGTEENIESERVQEVHLHFNVPRDTTHHVSARVGSATVSGIEDVGPLPPPAEGKPR